MAFGMLGYGSVNSNLLLTQGSYVDLVPQFNITTGGGDLQFVSYARGVTSDTWLQILLDGNQVANGQGDPNLNAIVSGIAAGTHTVRFQAMKANDDVGLIPTVTQRGITVLSLT